SLDCTLGGVACLLDGVGGTVTSALHRVLCLFGSVVHVVAHVGTLDLDVDRRAIRLVTARHDTHQRPHHQQLTNYMLCHRFLQIYVNASCTARGDLPGGLGYSNCMSRATPRHA